MDIFLLIVEILLLAVGFSMDAFAVSICKGVALKRVKPSQMAIVGAWFGGFQSLMPLIGFLVGMAASNFIKPFDHWIAFALLVLIGGNMLREAIFSKDEEEENPTLAPLSMLVLAIATSIDALAGGVDFSIRFAGQNYLAYIAIVAIGVITFWTSFGGVKLGAVCGTRFKKKAEITGAVILICMGIKILVQHLVEEGRLDFLFNFLGL